MVILSFMDPDTLNYEGGNAVSKNPVARENQGPGFQRLLIDIITSG